jgi:2-keto-3-deoxy-L-rhamnonate aldolase RhmA
MTTLRNSAKDKLEAGELVLGIVLRQARTVDIAKAMKTSGYDWLFIDLEHSTMSLDTAGQICVAAQDAGITPVVRVPGVEHYHAAKALDGGAQGIVLPHVDTPEVAARMVQYCRYAPIGHRSWSAALPQLDFVPSSISEGSEAIDGATLLIPMIETAQAVNQVDDIAAVDGIDVLLVGANDLSMSLGLPGCFDHPQMIEALEAIVRACKRHGRHAALGGINQPPLTERIIDMGYRMILTGSDLSLLMAGAGRRAAELRAWRSASTT